MTSTHVFVKACAKVYDVQAVVGRTGDQLLTSETGEVTRSDSPAQSCDCDRVAKAIVDP